MATRIFQPPESAPASSSIRSSSKSQAAQHLARLALERVTAEMIVFLLHFAEARQDGVHFPGPFRIGHRVLQRFQFVMEIADPPAAGNGLVEYGASRHLFDVLAEIAHGEFLRNRHLAVIRLLFADDHPEERGLAGPVRPDKADPFPRIELERRVNEENLTSVLFTDARKRDHTNFLG